MWFLPTALQNIGQHRSTYIKVFNEKLSLKKYNKWVIRNQYSKQIPVKSQVAVGMESTQNESQVYQLKAQANYKDPSLIHSYMKALYADVKLNDEYWPLFQHYVHLLADTFIYVRHMKFVLESEALSLFVGAMQSHNRLQCYELTVSPKRNFHKFIRWIKDHVLCNEIRVNVFTGYGDLNYDLELFDFIVTGATCTSEIEVTDYDLSKVIVYMVQKFMSLKSCDEFQIVESVRGNVPPRSEKEFKRDYAKFIVIEEGSEDSYGFTQVFDIINYNIGKKLQLTITHSSSVLLKIINL
ncbi:hypothetical protein Ddc_15281 [Ditylenchus destructor]|nr:hypothetical protein Ddc_15281 [Ditylenchus destructor]